MAGRGGGAALSWFVGNGHGPERGKGVTGAKSFNQRSPKLLWVALGTKRKLPCGQMVRVWCQRPRARENLPVRSSPAPISSSVSHSPSRRKMQRISNLSIAVMYVMYFLAALFGYLTFYGMARQRQRPGWGAGGWPVAMAPCML